MQVTIIAEGNHQQLVREYNHDPRVDYNNIVQEMVDNVEEVENEVNEDAGKSQQVN